MARRDVPPEQRIVVTGMGGVTPLGADIPTSWQALKEGKHGVRAIGDTALGLQEGPGAAAQVVAPAADVDVLADPLLAAHKTKLPVKRWHPSALLGFLAVYQALREARLLQADALALDPDQVDRFRVGLYLGSTFSGADELAEVVGLPADARVRPHNLFKYLPARAATAPGMPFRFGGPVGMIAEECASGGSAIRLGAKELLPYWGARADTDVMVVGGTDAELSAANLKFFGSIRAVDPTDDPERASRPFDEDRNGLVMAEGSGALVLESWAHAQARGLTADDVHAELVGMANLSDAENETKAGLEGTRAVIETVLEMAGIERGEIVYCNAHATSTLEGDPIEAVATSEAVAARGFDPKDFWVTSTKGATGHTMGAAGAIEAAFSILALRERTIPPALKLHRPIPEVQGFNLSPLEKTELPQVDAAISTSFGFGGTGAALAFRPFEA